MNTNDISKINAKNIDALKTNTTTNNNIDSGFLFDENTNNNNVENIITNSNIQLLQDKISPIAQTYKALKDVGAHSVTGLALNAMMKGNNIIKSASKQISRYSGEINSILNNNGLSEETVEKKIKQIEAKIESATKEASAKLDILNMLSDSLFEVYKFTMQAKSTGASTMGLVDFMINLINGIDVNSSTFPNTDNKDEMDEKLYEAMDNIYGKNTGKNIDKQKEDIEKKIEELTKKLENEILDSEEIAKISMMIEMFTFEINLLDNIENLIESFNPKDKN